MFGDPSIPQLYRRLRREGNRGMFQQEQGPLDYASSNYRFSLSATPQRYVFCVHDA